MTIRKLLSFVLSLCLVAPAFGSTKEEKKVTKIGEGVFSPTDPTSLPTGVEEVVATTPEATLPDSGNPVYTITGYVEVVLDPANTLIMLRLYSVVNNFRTQIGGPFYLRPTVVETSPSIAYTALTFAVDSGEGANIGFFPTVSWEMTAEAIGGTGTQGYCNISQLVAVRIQ